MATASRPPLAQISGLYTSTPFSFSERKIMTDTRGVRHPSSSEYGSEGERKRAIRAVVDYAERKRSIGKSRRRTKRGGVGLQGAVARG